MRASCRVMSLWGFQGVAGIYSPFSFSFVLAIVKKAYLYIQAVKYLSSIYCCMFRCINSGTKFFGSNVHVYFTAINSK